MRPERAKFAHSIGQRPMYKVVSTSYWHYTAGRCPGLCANLALSGRFGQCGTIINEEGWQRVRLPFQGASGNAGQFINLLIS